MHPAKVNGPWRSIQNVRSLLMAGFRAEGITTKLAPYDADVAGMACALADAEGSTYHKTEPPLPLLLNQGIAPMI